MSASKRGFILVAAILATITLVWVVCSWPPSRSRRMADGSVLRVEKVSFGKRDPAYLPEISLWEQAKAKVAAMLPKKWAAKITLKKFSSNGTWWYSAKLHTNEDALHIWITQRDQTNGFGIVQADAAELVDEHGYIYQATQSGGVSGAIGLTMRGGGPTGSAVTWFTFEAFPRHDSKMRLRLFKSFSGWGTAPSTGLLAEFVIRNPAPKPADPAKWPTEPLPIERKYGDVSFILKGVGFKTNWTEVPTNTLRTRYYANPVEIVPKFEVFEHGRRLPESEVRGLPYPNEDGQVFGDQPPEWEALDMELTDSSGNIAPKQWGNNMSVFLSPREPAWKLAVKFFGSEQESAASNEVWVMRGVKVPGPADYTALGGERELEGLSVRPVALAGAGEATYDGDQLTTISEHKSGDHNMISFVNRSQETADSTTPHIAVRLGEMAEDQRLTIRAVAPGNEEYYAEGWKYAGKTKKFTNDWIAKLVKAELPSSGDGDARQAHPILYLKKSQEPYHLSYFLLDLPPEVKTVDLYFCVHRARTVEFVFKPPQQ